MKQNNYLGTEKVGVLLKQFAIPCIFSLIISCLYNIVDQIFVGNGVGYLGHLSMIFNAKWQNFCIRKILMPALV